MNYASSILGLLPGGRRAPGIGQLVTKIEAYLPPDQVERVREAFDYAETAHKGQKRRSGEAFITHPVAVADILADLHLDGATLQAAILHDVVEDTPSSMAEVEQKFGKEVAEIVDGVTKLDQIQFKSRKEAQAESFRKMLLAMVRDIRVIMVKLADRTHNMRTLSAMPQDKRRAVARETLDIYAPIANRLGIHSVKLELEEIGFRTLYPQRYRIIERELKRARGNQREFLPKIVKAVRKSLADAGVNGQVEAREKHLHSVYVKMRRKHLSLSQVVDMFGIRIVVGSVDECYRSLGLVHGLYRPMPGRFKDYIAIPRVNGYQSLHTSLFGPNGTPIEVQIRTQDMHRMAESGIAAHWQYKTGEKEGESQQARAREWLQGVMDLHEGSAEELVESVKMDLFPDKVYVFTPKGDIMRLPRGSTCVDFAYAVHTGVGQRCVAAKVDRRLVPLRTVLRNGQTVEIITAKGAQPNPTWASFVATAKARSSIRQYLKSLKKGEAAELGGRMLNQALEEFELNVKKLPEGRLDEVARSLSLKDGQRTAREDRARRAPRAPGRAAAPARRRHAPGRRDHAAARDRWHRGPRRQLRALLLPDSLRRGRRLPVERARRRRPPRQLLERRRVRQAAGQVDLRGLAEGPAAPVQLGPPGRGEQPHGNPGRDRDPHRRRAEQHQPRQRGLLAGRPLDDPVRGPGQGPCAPRAPDPRDPRHAGRHEGRAQPRLTPPGACPRRRYTRPRGGGHAKRQARNRRDPRG